MDAVETTNFNWEPGFTRRVDPAAARRQLNLSIGLVIALALASLTVALTLRIPSAPISLEPGRTVVQSPQFMPLRQAVRVSEQGIGG